MRDIFIYYFSQKRNFINRLILLLVPILLIIAGCGGGGGGVGGGSSGSSTSSAILIWDAPTTDSDGSPLNDLAGYKIYYGSTGNYTASIDVGNTRRYDTSVHSSVTCFVVVAYDNLLNESEYSDEVCK